MNKITKILSVIGLFVLTCCIMYAVDREYTITDALFSSRARNEKAILKVAEEGSDTNISTYENVTLAANNTVHFSDDFEGINSQWTFTNDIRNKWYIGTATQNGGKKSMYISNDAGVSNKYTSNNNVSFAESTVINLASDIVDLELNFDWKSVGESSYDFGQVWLMPSTYVATAKTSISVADGGILIKDRMSAQTSYKSERISFNIDKLDTKSVKLVWQWKDDTSFSGSSALAVDNIVLSSPKCQSFSNFEIGSVTVNSINLTWTALAAGKSAEIYSATTNTAPTATTTGVIVATGGTHTLTNLVENTLYYIWHRVQCTPGETSKWNGPFIIRTPCVIQSIPYEESFNSASVGVFCWSVEDLNEDATSPTGSNLWRTISSGTYEGNGSMYFSGGGDLVDHDDWLISPTFTLEQNSMYQLSYYYKTTDSYTNDFEVLLSKNGKDINSFTTVLVPTNQYNNTNFIRKVVYIQGVAGDVNLAWHVTTLGRATIYIDHVNLKKVDCVSPTDLAVNNVTINSVDLSWTDTTSTSWEYWIQEPGLGEPTSNGTVANTKSIKVTKDHLNNNIVSNKAYEVYVRSKCTNGGYSAWEGPVQFATLCDVMTLPFEESFNSTSSTLKCWSLLDLNNDATSPTGNNLWRINSSGTHEGNGTMYFYGSYNAKNHDDWLISPDVNFIAGEFYRLTYYYYSSTYTGDSNEFEVVLFKGGVNTANPTQVIVPKATYRDGKYVKKEVYLQGHAGIVNIGWHITGDGYSSLRIDNVSIEKIDCLPPMDLSVSTTSTTSADLSWTDNNNTAWEYFVQEKGKGVPTKNGVATTSKSPKVTKDIDNTNLVAGTNYEYYLRAKCANGGYSSWGGPKAFFTQCEIVVLPFIETFNTGSAFLKCWEIVDVNNDATSATGNNLWRTTSSGTNQGNGSMYFSGASLIDHDDWLITPTVQFDQNSIYKLTYYYKTSSSNTNDFEVVLSNTGKAINSFTTILVPKSPYNNASFIRKDVFIQGVAGEVNIAWHIQTSGSATIYIDDVSLEKVDCISPSSLDVINVGMNNVDIAWTDPNNTSWEYWVQPKTGKAPTGNGVATTTNQLNVTQDSKGNNLTPGTMYEYYVRASCANGGNSLWEGPIEFVTLCASFTPPFDESFNTSSTSLKCWITKDTNKDATSATGSNLWRTIASGTFDGNGAMYFSGNSGVKHDDWLISPPISLTGKMYKVSYQYKTSTTNHNDFDLLMSTNGIDFTGATVLISKKSVNNSAYKEEVIYVDNITSDVHFGFKVTAENGCIIYIDSFKVEETNCVDPMNIEFGKVTSTSIDVSWVDTVNTEWEYIVQVEGSPLPTGNGVAATTTNVVLNALTVNNTPLQPLTTYEFYIRSVCGGWQGPYSFTTSCINMTLPFLESFDQTSTTMNCWQTIDVKKDATSPTGDNLWRYNASGGVTGGAMYFSGGYSTKHNDLLISPTFRFLANQTYKLSFKYKMNSSSMEALSVKISNTGTRLEDFTTVLLPNVPYINSAYQTESVYIQGLAGDVNIAWHLEAESSSTLYIDDVEIKLVACIGPNLNDIEVSNITATSAKIEWDYTHNNTSHAYYVQLAGAPAPVSGGVNSTNNNVTVSAVNSTGGGALLPDTEYDVYIRSNCGAGKYSDWIGPITFRTKCAVMTLPYWEGFNTDSTTIECWTFINKDKLATPLSSTGRWGLDNYTKYEGDRGVEFYGSFSGENDDWLLSPSFTTVNTKYYRLKYHYRAYSSSTKGNIRVAYSTTNADISAMTNVVVPYKELETNVWEEENIVFKGTNTAITFGWHVVGEGTAGTDIDNIFIEEVQGCPEPSDLGVRNEQSNSATLFWDQKFEGSEWEYYVQKTGGTAPTATATGGVKVTTKQANATADAQGNTLLNNTEYDFYVRTVCNATANSIWIGPFKFMTTCGEFILPFDEGFNESSLSLRCWSIVDNNADALTATASNIWRLTASTKFEGSQAMEFNGTASKKHDDWLISPILKLDATKTYRVKYKYRTNSSLVNVNELAVLLSTSGQAVANFTNVIKAKQVYENTTNWKQEYLLFTGYGGDSNIAFHINSNGSTSFFIDQFSIEEVINCPEPINLDVTGITHDEATLSWTDDFGATKFEYFVQEVGKRVPRLNDRGTPTTSKSVVATKDIRTKLGLLPNVDYEFYVRTLCNATENSIWNGPFKFRTLCGVYQAPFIEDFNTTSSSIKCWSILDPRNIKTQGNSNTWKLNDATKPFEGDKHASYVGNKGRLHDGWLISPGIELDGGNYVLKYQYKIGNKNQANEFAVLVSTNGVNISDFTTTLVSKKIYQNEQYIEEVVYFNSILGTANFGWHVTSNGATSIQIDKFEVKKITTCPEPFNVQVTGQTSTSINVTWQEYGTATTWEVIAVKMGEAIPAQPNQVITVTTTPAVTITNLSSNMFYTIYVRSICSDGTSRSDWSTGKDAYTIVGANDECSSPIKLTANNNLEECIKLYKGVTTGMTISTNTFPDCWPNVPNSDPVEKEGLKDQWFEFTPDNAMNVFKFQNVLNLATGASSAATFYVAIYDVNCAGITSTAKWCTTISTTNTTGYSISNMIPGQRYLIRVAYKPAGTDTHSFELCIGSHNAKYLEVIPSQPAETGDPDSPDFVPDPTRPYTIDKLVKDVLVNSNCKLVSNVRYQNSNGSDVAQSFNTIGYFNRGDTDFPFEEGIVLSTSTANNVPGPIRTSTGPGNSNRWLGDKDINEAIDDTGSRPTYPSDKSMRSTILEFDFVPIKEVLTFEYLFASNSYSSGCSNVRCNAGALFAAWLIDAETGKGMNLAKINGTDIPIALNTIVDHTRTGKSCPSMNPEMYWRHYEGGVNNPFGADINFIGLTHAMKSDETIVVPGRKYKIKLAVVDFCDNTPHTSAAFFKAGSFDLGDLDLGADLTVANNNAICNAESKTIATGLGTENVDITWYKDDVKIDGETKPTIEVTETGLYRVEAFYKTIQCPVKGEIYAEIYPAISEVVAKAQDIGMCRYSLGTQKINLQAVIDQMFEGVEREPYVIQAYRTEDDLEYATNQITELEAYEIQPNEQDEMIYFRIEDTRTGCMEVFPLRIKIEEGEQPETPENVLVCETYILPALKDNQYYYLLPNGEGERLNAGDALKAGTYEVYIFQDNQNGCYEQVSYQVEVTEKTPIQHFEDVELSCALYILEDLKDGSKYFVETNGVRVELQPGTPITSTNTKVFIVMESENKVCREETSFMVRYNDCPIPKGISPNGDGINDSFDLTQHGVTSIKVFNRSGNEVYSFQGLYTNQWTGLNKSDKPLPSGTYYYVIQSFDKTRTGWVEINR